MKSLFVAMLSLLSLNAVAQTASMETLIQQLNVELPPGSYQGKGYKHPCRIEVESDGSTSYRAVVTLTPVLGKEVSGEFEVFADSQVHPNFETKNYVGYSQAEMRSFVVAATGDEREGHRLIINQKGGKWSIKAGVLTGRDATCIIDQP